MEEDAAGAAWDEARVAELERVVEEVSTASMTNSMRFAIAFSPSSFVIRAFVDVGVPSLGTIAVSMSCPVFVVVVLCCVTRWLCHLCLIAAGQRSRCVSCFQSWMT